MIARAWVLVLAALASVAALVPAARAHQEPYSYLDVRVEPQGLRGTLIAHIVDLAHETGVADPPTLLAPAEVTARFGALTRMLDGHVRITADGAPVRLRWTGFTVLPERRSVSFAWQSPRARPPGELRIDGPLFPYDPPHETYLNVYEGGTLRHQDLLDHARREAVVYGGGRQGVLAVVRSFVAQGMHHIFIGPDHILFIVGLLLLGGSVGRLLKIVTAFTLAHSVTLALAALRIVDPPPRLIEPAIALSIVYIGVETLVARERRRDWRAAIAFAFGFVHGFGFAGVLREFGLPPSALGWSLASFNVGVELGQSIIVLAVAPTLALLGARRPAVAHRVVTAGSALIIAAGSYWFVQRVFFAA